MEWHCDPTKKMNYWKENAQHMKNITYYYITSSSRVSKLQKLIAKIFHLKKCQSLPTSWGMQQKDNGTLTRTNKCMMPTLRTFHSVALFQTAAMTPCPSLFPETTSFTQSPCCLRLCNYLVLKTVTEQKTDACHPSPSAGGRFFLREDRSSPQTPTMKQLTLKMSIVALS